jgi:hypothetical protein
MDPPRHNGCGHGLMETSFDFQRAFHRRTFTLVRLSLSNRRPGAGPRICRTRAALTERTCRPRHGAHQGERMTSHRTDQPSCPAAPAAPFGCWWSAVPTASPGREPVLSRTPGRRHPSDPDSCLRTQSLPGQPRRFGTRMSRRPGSAGTMRGHALGTVVARHAHWRKPDLTVQLQCGIARPTSAAAESRSTDRTNNDDHMKAEQS